MYCVNCGEKLRKNAKKCPKCGHEIQTELKDGKLRKALKRDARLKPKEALMLGTLFLMAMWFIVSLMFDAGHVQNSEALTFIPMLYFAIMLVVGVFINFGLAGASLDSARNKKTTIVDVFTRPAKHLQSIFIYLLLIIAIVSACFFAYKIVESACPILDPILAAVYGFLIIYFCPVLEALLYIIMDTKKEKPFIDMYLDAHNLVRGHRVEFFGMAFSFIGWVIVNMFTFGILTVWLLPYFRLAEANMYLNWKGEGKFEAVGDGLSNETIIAIVIAGYIIMLFMLISLMALIVTFLY